MKILISAALLGTASLGGVAQAQLAPAAAPMARPMAGDANGDGRVSHAEFLRQAEARFARLDANHDGALTRDERRAGMRARHAMFGARGGIGRPFAAVGGAQVPPPPPGAAMMGPAGRGGMMRLDTDGDGRITRAEFDAQSAARFARMDTNGDGTVDAAEMAAMPGGGRMGARMGGRADADHNVALTRAEFDTRARERFARMDTNGDGVIDAAELRAGAMRRGGPDGMRHRGPADRPAPPPTVPPAPPGA